MVLPLPAPPWITISPDWGCVISSNWLGSMSAVISGSRLSAHRNDMGEEYLVLSGTFSDNAGDFPEGAYVRNPPGSSHAPHTDDGAVILVKLRQMPDGQRYFCIAKAIAKGGYSYNAPRRHIAIGLGCHVSQASAMITPPPV